MHTALCQTTDECKQSTPMKVTSLVFYISTNFQQQKPLEWLVSIFLSYPQMLYNYSVHRRRNILITTNLVATFFSWAASFYTRQMPFLMQCQT